MVTRRTFLGGLIGSAIAPSLANAVGERDIEPEFLSDLLRAGQHSADGRPAAEAPAHRQHEGMPG